MANLVVIKYLIIMGKGDKKTARGKIIQGSYGKTRPRKASKSAEVPEKVEKVKAEPKSKVEKTEKIESSKPKKTKKTED